MANDINDILGINLPKEEPASKSKIISDLLQNLVFSLGQGYSAQGGARGSQARSAGIGAALQGPMVLQQIRDKQQADAQERQINLVKARELFRQNRNAEAMDLLKIRTQLPEETTMTPPPAPTEPVIEGTPETGLTVKSLGTPTYAKPRPEMITLPNGQQVPISPPSAGDVRNQGYAADARTLALEEAKKRIDAQYREPDYFNTPGGTIKKGQSGFIPGTTPQAEPPVLSPDVVTVDGKGPVPVFRDKQGNYFDATTKRPVTGMIGVYERPDRAPDQSARADRSFTAQTKEIDDEAAPVRDGLQRVGRLISTLDAGSPVADAVTAPELMVVMAGGVGSGVRITQGEINTIFGAQSKIEQAKAALKQFSTDPDKANRILEPMRAQMRQLVDAVNDKLQKKQAIITTARQALIDTDDVKKQRQIVADAKAAMVRVDAGRVKMVGSSGQEFWVDADKVEAAKKVGGRIVPPPKL